MSNGTDKDIGKLLALSEEHKNQLNEIFPRLNDLTTAVSRNSIYIRVIVGILLLAAGGTGVLKGLPKILSLLVK